MYRNYFVQQDIVFLRFDINIVLNVFKGVFVNEIDHSRFILHLLLYFVMSA